MEKLVEKVNVNSEGFNCEHCGHVSDRDYRFYYRELNSEVEWCPDCAYADGLISEQQQAEAQNG